MTQVTQAAEQDRFVSLTRQMSKWMDHVLGPSYHRYRPGEAWRPAINVYEDKTHYSIVIDLAGLKAEEIDLRLENNVMILSGDRATPGPPDARSAMRTHLMEIDHGRFCREIEMPEDADTDNADDIRATYRNGYLWVRIQKRR